MELARMEQEIQDLKEKRLATCTANNHKSSTPRVMVAKKVGHSRVSAGVKGIGPWRARKTANRNSPKA